MKMLRVSDELAVGLETDQWVIQDVLGGMGVVWGPSGSYKTFVALSMALAVATGKAWYGHEVIQGRVVYVVGEGGWGRFAYRIMAAAKEMGISVESLDQFHVIPSPVDLSRESKETAELFVEIAKLPTKPVLIVIDTLSRCLPGDENKQEAMQGFVSTLDEIRQEWGTTVLVIHHANRQGTIRGSTVLRAAADVSIETKRGTDGHNRCLHLVADKLKEADTETFEPKMLYPKVVGVFDHIGQPALDSFGDKVTTLVFQENLELKGREKVAYDAFVVLAHARPADQAVGYKEWMEAAGQPPMTFKRALGGLLADQKISRAYRGHYFLYGMGPDDLRDVVMGDNHGELDPHTKTLIEEAMAIDESDTQFD